MTEPRKRTGLASLASAGEDEDFSVIDAIGGPRGVVESMLPGVVFVALFVITSNLELTVIVSAMLAVLQVIVRLIQRQSAVGAASGLLAVGICLIWAWQSHEARNYRAWLDDWMQDKPLKRAYTIITALWIGVFSLRLLVQVPLYLTDQVGWLGTARLLMGIPFWALMIWISYLIIATPMHHHKALHAAAEEQPGEQEPQRPDA